MNLAVRFIRAKSSLILSCSSGPFLLHIYATCRSGGEKEENCGWKEEKWERLISLQ